MLFSRESDGEVFTLRRFTDFVRKCAKQAVSLSIRKNLVVCFVAVAAISNRGALSIRNNGFPGLFGAGGLDSGLFSHNIFMDSMERGEKQIAALWNGVRHVSA